MELADLPLVLASLTVPLLCVFAAARFSVDAGLRLRAGSVPWPVAALGVLGLHGVTTVLLTCVAALTWTVGMSLQDALGPPVFSPRAEATVGIVLWLGALVSVVASIGSGSAALAMMAFGVFDRRRGAGAAPTLRRDTGRQLMASIAVVAVGTLAVELTYCAADHLINPAPWAQGPEPCERTPASAAAALRTAK